MKRPPAFHVGWRPLFAAAVDLLLPPVCRLCGAAIGSTDDFCHRCEAALRGSEAWMRNGCRRCGFPIGPPADSAGHRSPADLDPRADLDEESPDARINDSVSACPRCRGEELSVDRVVSLWAYNDRVADAIIAAKYARNTPLADALGRRLGDAAAEKFSCQMPDLVTYVPSHLVRQFSRGGIGSRAIAVGVAAQINRPLRNLLRVTRPIKKQAWLGDQARKQNVRGAFASIQRRQTLKRSLIANRHVLVVDDVVTTGATINEVAGVLKQAGAARVSAAVVARSIRQS